MQQRTDNLAGSSDGPLITHWSGGGVAFLDEPGVAQELDEHLVDEDVLRDGLHHHHPLLAEHAQNRRDVKHLHPRENRFVALVF